LKEIGNENNAQFGLRLNPMVGVGAIDQMSTAGVGSKFGVPVNDETFEEFYSYFEKYPWLTGIHCHVGSQGCPIEMGAKGATTTFQTAEKINERLGRQQITSLDIGGGVPTSYTAEVEAHSYQDYRDILDKTCPKLFSGKYRIITEFGRSMFTKNGMTISFVASTKKGIADGTAMEKLRHKNNVDNMLFIHTGSNSMLREAYRPEQWKHRFTAYDKNGDMKNNDVLIPQDIAGPLCFQGDYLGKGIKLPEVSQDDILVCHDTGGYTYSLYSKFNSRPAHSVYGVQKTDKSYNFRVFKKKETIEQTLEFWGNATGHQIF
jgi:diaminopimelate decarboxylase